MKDILYEVKIELPTNSGEYSIKKIFESEEDARVYVNHHLEDCEEDSVQELEIHEWYPEGPNWKVIASWGIDEDEYITIARIDNSYKEV